VPDLTLISNRAGALSATVPALGMWVASPAIATAPALGLRVASPAIATC